MAKERLCFVSNSSSSSFIIAVPEKVELTTDSLVKTFKVSKNSPIYGIAEEIAKALVNQAEEYSVTEYLYNFGLDSVSEIDLNLQKLYAKGWHVYSGYVSDEDCGVDAMLCNMALNIKTSTLFIEKKAGY